jgi:alkanesulfonate monooxygenase SsuD/methylene tetrahydromethanopterin reductase-like flavin-dependent oxidoreductase (luciferase family)
MFGLDLLEIGPRMRRFREGLDVVTLLLNSEKPVSYAGKFYQLEDAIMLPRPQRPGGPKIVVGGNGKRTLQLAAKYAHEWNGTGQTPASFRERSQQLDEYLKAEGRKPSDLRRTLMIGTFFGNDAAKLERVVKISGRSKEELRAGGRLVGGASEIAEQLGELQEAGCQRVMLQWLDQDDIDGLEAMAKTVLPQFKD